MKLKSTSLYARAYVWLLGPLPSNLCPLFWNTLIAIVLLPFVLITRILQGSPFEGAYYWTSNAFTRAMYGLLVFIMFNCIAFIGTQTVGGILEFEDFFKYLGYNYWLILIIGLAFWLSVLIALALIFFLGYLIYQLSERRAESRRHAISKLSSEEYSKWYADRHERRNRPSRIKLLWDTFMNRYCTKIDWE